MELQKKYTTEKKKAKDAAKEKDKVVLSDDCYALCEVIEYFANRLVIK